MITFAVIWKLTCSNFYVVYLKAPELEPPASLTARNATLSWKWYTLLKDTSFSMICQVEVNGHIINVSVFILIKEIISQGNKCYTVAAKDGPTAY